MKYDQFCNAVKFMADRKPLPAWATMPADQSELDLRTVRLQRSFHKTRFDRYGDYLASREWRERRQIVLALARGRCGECGKTATQVHHLSYQTPRGYEKFADLMPLCDACHEAKHPDKPRGSTPGAAQSLADIGCGSAAWMRKLVRG